MDFDKFKLLVKGMKSIYTAPNFLPDEFAVKMWYSFLKDYSYEVLSLAIQKFVVKSKYPPTVAELRQLAVEVTQGASNDWGKGWEQVNKAIRYYGYYQEKEALETMDDITRQTVQRLGFQNLCMSENLANDRANFRMIFEELDKRAKEEAQVPLALKEKINKALISNKENLGIEKMED